MARRRIILFALVGIAFYALAMLATMPASIAFRNQPWRTGVAGTVWNGEVGIAGGASVEWQWAPLRSLTSLGYAADWKATGPDTDLGGRVLAGTGRTVLDKVSGSAHASLLEAVLPGLPFTCDLTMQVDIERMVIGGSGQMMRGRIAGDPGSCRPKGTGAAAPVPALMLTAEKIGAESRVRVVPLTQRRRTLVEMTIQENGAYALRVTQDGAALLPFLGIPPGTRIQGEM